MGGHWRGCGTSAARSVRRRTGPPSPSWLAPSGTSTWRAHMGRGLAGAQRRSRRTPMPGLAMGCGRGRAAGVAPGPMGPGGGSPIHTLGRLAPLPRTPPGKHTAAARVFGKSKQRGKSTWGWGTMRERESGGMAGRFGHGAHGRHGVRNRGWTPAGSCTRCGGVKTARFAECTRSSPRRGRLLGKPACAPDWQCTLKVPALVVGDFNCAFDELPESRRACPHALRPSIPSGLPRSGSSGWRKEPESAFGSKGGWVCRCTPATGRTCPLGHPRRSPPGGRGVGRSPRPEVGRRALAMLGRVAVGARRAHFPEAGDASKGKSVRVLLRSDQPGHHPRR